MLLVGLLGLYFLVTSGGILRNAWNGSRPVTLPDLISAISFIVLPLWGMRTWWIHRNSLNGDEEGASSRWLETGGLMSHRCYFGFSFGREI
jgi:hypothetical protein